MQRLACAAGYSVFDCRSAALSRIGNRWQCSRDELQCFATRYLISREKVRQMIVLLFSILLAELPAESPDVGLFVRSVWLFQQQGTPAASHDELLKSSLAKAIANDGEITLKEMDGLMTHERFKKIAGDDMVMNLADVAGALKTDMPASRAKLHEKLRSHADYLTTTFDMIDEPHRQAAQKLAEWIVANYETGKPIEAIVVCTGNSRRSILGSSMGNMAAAYYGLDVHFYSGGTAPSAFNRRTVAALRDAGFVVTDTGAEAKRGSAKTLNPKLRIQWGDGLETIEFSKRFSDESNPRTDFAALMVCSEADAECPTVPGAALRLSTPYLDPKVYDGSAFEAAKYNERRDDIGRMMLTALCQVRRELNAK